MDLFYCGKIVITNDIFINKFLTLQIMDSKMVEIFACPFHQDNDLIYEKDKDFFVCTTCNKKYEIINSGGIKIPNFLIDNANWKKGSRGVKSSFIKKIQGKIFNRQIEDNKLVLDVGCGENARGNINLDCYIPENIPKNFVLANAEYLPFKKNSVDIILSNYNIEHLINPAIFIQKNYEIAKEKLEIITDNSEWLGDAFFRLYGDGRIFNDEHYYKWSVEYFDNLIKRLGYKNSKVHLLNLSSNFLVKLFSVFGKIPRIGNFFYRDLKAEIWKQ